MTICFRANGKPNLESIPEWLVVEYSLAAKEPRFYSIWVKSWIAEPAIALGTIELDGSLEGWIAYLETLGFDDVVSVPCYEFFGPRADRDH